MGGRKPSRSFPIEVEVDGKRFAGHYEVEKGLLTVSTNLLGTKSTQVGGFEPEALARILLLELASKSKGS